MKLQTQTLHLPNPGDWLTRYAAADRLGVDTRTVDRLVAAGTLTAYHPRTRPDTRCPVMFWAPEVEEVARARNRLGRS